MAHQLTLSCRLFSRGHAGLASGLCFLKRVTRKLWRLGAKNWKLPLWNSTQNLGGIGEED